MKSRIPIPVNNNSVETIQNDHLSGKWSLFGVIRCIFCHVGQSFSNCSMEIRSSNSFVIGLKDALLFIVIIFFTFYYIVKKIPDNLLTLNVRLNTQ